MHTTSLPENYDTIIKQTSLCGGQKQRICIACAILANLPILLLDEATAALDTKIARLVQKSLESIDAKQQSSLHTYCQPSSIQTASISSKRAKLSRQAHTRSFSSKVATTQNSSNHNSKNRK